MTKYAEIGGLRVPFIASHNGGTAVHPNGGTTTISSLPSETRAIYMSADGAAYYEVNGTAAGTASSGYIASGGNSVVLTCDNLSSISFSSAAGVTVYVQYYTALA